MLEFKDVPLPFDTPDASEPFVNLICGDVIDTLNELDDQSVHCIVTSPPYYGLRSYGIEPRKWSDGSVCVLGDEPSVEQYVEHMVEVFNVVKRVLHPHGSLWLNLGDCYAGGGNHPEETKYPGAVKPLRAKQKRRSGKDLLLVPAQVALGLQRDGWILRQDNIWAKALSFCPAYSGSVMPESTRDRTTWAHEHVFHFQLNEDAFYDQDGCREPYAASTIRDSHTEYTGRGTKPYAQNSVQNPSDVKRRVLAGVEAGGGRNLRNVWVIAKQNFPGSHFATFPEKLVEPIVKLATSERGACVKCGEQVRRKVIREPVPADIQARFEASRAQTRDETGRTDGHTSKRPNYRRKVLREEWEAGCDCGVERVPAVVLDIFVGSGRAGIVAKKLGRSFIGIDVNQDYINMADIAIREVTYGAGIPQQERQAERTDKSQSGAQDADNKGVVSGGLFPERA